MGMFRCSKSSLLRALLLLLLSSFYLRPDQIPSLPQHVYHVLLGRGIELHRALHPPDAVRSLSQRLRGVLRLLLVTFGHHDLLSKTRFCSGGRRSGLLPSRTCLGFFYTRRGRNLGQGERSRSKTGRLNKVDEAVDRATLTTLVVTQLLS